MVPASEVLAELAERHAADEPGGGKPGVANTFDSGLASVERVAVAAYESYLHVNGLYPTSFPSISGLEHDVVAMVGERLNAPAGAAGSWTSGGTESCLLAAKAARDAHPEIDAPEIVFARTAHAAWLKAAKYFGLKAVVTDVEHDTLQVDPQAFADAITERTVLVVVSAPSYGHGVLDPVEAVAAVCAERGVRLHVDACIGGWVLPYAEKLGYPVRPWDFRVSGVTSISVDLHKYGYAPKGCSVVLYRTAQLRRSQYFVTSRWTGYPVVNPTMQSSKAGGLLAAAWAVMRHLGDDGYLDLVRATMAATTDLVDGVRAIDGLRVLGTPAASLVAITTDGPDFFAFLDELEARGWPIQPQLSQPGVPAAIHLTLTATHGKYVSGLLEALTESTAAARGRDPLPTPEQRAKVSGLPEDAPPDQLFGLVGEALAEAGGRMAPIHALLDSLPPALQESALLAFFEGLNPPL
jgi:sphinganine-1-phosphate aldolase